MCIWMMCQHKCSSFIFCFSEKMKKKLFFFSGLLFNYEFKCVCARLYTNICTLVYLILIPIHMCFNFNSTIIDSLENYCMVQVFSSHIYYRNAFIPFSIFSRFALWRDLILLFYLLNRIHGIHMNCFIECFYLMINV